MGITHNSKRLQSVGKSISAYQDNAGRLFWCLSCSCSTAGCGYTSKQSSTTEPLGLPYFTVLYHFSQPSETSLFLPQHCCKNRTKNTNIAWPTSQANEQAKDHMVGVTLRESWIIIQSVWIHFQSTSQGRLDMMRIWYASEFKWIHVNVTNWIRCAFDTHISMHYQLNPPPVVVWMRIQVGLYYYSWLMVGYAYHEIVCLLVSLMLYRSSLFCPCSDVGEERGFLWPRRVVQHDKIITGAYKRNNHQFLL